MNVDGASLAGLTILSCRQLGRGLDLDASVESCGGRVVRLPLVEPRPPADGGVALAQALGGIGNYDWLVCTSANGVDALGDVELPSGLQLAAVGPFTGEVLNARAQRAVDLIPPVHTARGLAQAFPAGQGRVLAPLAELADADLEVGLTGKGWSVDVVRAYSTAVPNHSADQRAEALRADVVVLTAPSIVRRLVEVLGCARPERAVVTGPKTAAAAEAEGFDVVQVEPAAVLSGLVIHAGRIGQ